MMRPIHAIPAMALLLLAGCGREPPLPARFDGVVQADQVAFVTSPSRCLLSLLYDDFRIEWLPGEVPAAGKTVKEGRRFLRPAMSPAARGKPLIIDVRGGYLSSGASSATLAFQVGERQFALDLSPDPANSSFYRRVEAVLGSGDVTDVTIQIRMPQPADPSDHVQISIDTVDIALVAGGCGSSEEEKKATRPPPDTNLP